MKDFDYYISRLDNPNYRVIIRGGNQPKIRVQGILEHDVSSSLQSEWASAFQISSQAMQAGEDFVGLGQMLVGFGADAINAAGKMTGLSAGTAGEQVKANFDPFSLKSQVMSQVKWTNAGHMVLPINLTFIAKSRETARKDVMLPVQEILRAVYPRKSSTTGDYTFSPPLGMLPSQKSGLLSVHIGRWLGILNYFVMPSATYTYSRTVNADGVPVMSRVQCQLMTYQVPDADIIAEWFSGQQGSPGLKVVRSTGPSLPAPKDSSTLSTDRKFTEST